MIFKNSFAAAGSGGRSGVETACSVCSSSFGPQPFRRRLGHGALTLRAAYVIMGCIAVMAAAGIGFYAVFIQRYSMALFYLACFKDISVFEAIEESVKKTGNRLAEIALFKLGFLPWFLISLGVAPALFVIPYYKQSITCYFLNNR